MEYLNEIIWNPSFWLPPNTTWRDFEDTKSGDGHRIPQIGDIFTVWKLVPLLLLIRYTCERYLFVKLASWAGLNEKRREKPPNVDLLETAYRLNPKKKWEDLELTAFSKRLDWPKKFVQEWFRARKNFERPTALVKFCESFWRSALFTCIFTHGLRAHWTKEWFWDFKLCWKDFPQPVSEDLYWYYIVSLTNYCSWGISHFWDVQRKDPGVMMFHHFVTVTLLTLQWVSRFHRIGLLICLFHDIGDLWLEVSKCLKYLGFKLTCQVMGILLVVVWIITRNIIFPIHLMPNLYFYSPHNVPQSFPFSCLHGPCDISSFSFTTTHILVLSLVSLTVLHAYWTCLIFKVLYLALFVGKFEDETISDDDENAN